MYEVTEFGLLTIRSIGQWFLRKGEQIRRFFSLLHGKSFQAIAQGGKLRCETNSHLELDRFGDGRGYGT
jgi:hypothetical protein